MYAFVALGGYFALEAVTGIDFHILRKMLLPLIAGTLCAVTAYLCENMLFKQSGVFIRLFASIGAGGFIYIILLILFNEINIKSLLNRQKRKKCGNSLDI